MSHTHKQIQTQFGKLTQPVILNIDSPIEISFHVNGIKVFVDYHKRKGLKLCASIFRLDDGIPESNILSLLLSESKISKKKKEVGKIEWGGDDEVLFVQCFPKNIIEDGQLSNLNEALTSYQENLLDIQKKLISMRNRGKRDQKVSERKIIGHQERCRSVERDFSKAIQEVHKSLSPPRRTTSLMPQRESIAQPRRTISWQPTSTTLPKPVDTAENLSANSNVNARRYMGFGRKNKKAEPQFMALDDDDDSCDDESAELLSNIMISNMN
jgi:hypothetical protein